MTSCPPTICSAPIISPFFPIAESIPASEGFYLPGVRGIHRFQAERLQRVGVVHIHQMRGPAAQSAFAAQDILEALVDLRESLRP